MGDKTGIEWTDATWNPVTGCTKVSQGCKFCYAETVAERFWAKQYPPNEDGTPRKFTDIRIHPERLDQPLRWKRPRRIFVNSMSDLFHEGVPDSFIHRIFAIMAIACQHNFQILTKRPQRMFSFLSDQENELEIFGAIDEICNEWGYCPQDYEWPLKNVWLGVSVEDQTTADQRIPVLLQVPAAVRFLSCEPLLEPVDLDLYLGCGDKTCTCGNRGVDWVIVGGESGANARPMHPDWVRDIRDICAEAWKPFFFKQWGEWKPGLDEFIEGDNHPRTAINLKSSSDEYQVMQRVGKKSAGRLLDGREWNEFPEVE